MIPYRKNVAILFQKIHEDTNSRFVFKFHGNRPPWSEWQTMRCLADKSLQGSVRATWPNVSL